MPNKPSRQYHTYTVPVEKDAEGYPLCRWCKQSIRTGKRPKLRTFCDDPNCVHEWKIRSNPGYAAEQVLKRDHGVCCKCGLDCVLLLRNLQKLSYYSVEFKRICDENEIPENRRTLKRRLWEMDHIVPVAEGGGTCGLENLRTLCWKCHSAETKALAGRLAEARKKKVA